jgi:hypothetical protein
MLSMPYDLVFDATKTSDPKEAAKKLSFLMRLGYLDDPDGKINFFLEHTEDIPIHDSGDYPPADFPDRP